MNRQTAWIALVTLLVPSTPRAQATAEGAPRQRSAAVERLLAAERGETPEVQALVAGGDPNARDTTAQRTALMWSIIRHDPAAFDRFMRAGADVNTVDGRDKSALDHAVELAMSYDTAPMVEALIAMGARVVAADGTSPLILAANANNPAIVRAILTKLDPAAIDKPTGDGITPLMAAAAVGARDVAWLLIEKGAKIDLSDLQGRTPLMHAAGRRFPGTVDTVKLLLDMGANPSARDKEGKTALSEAEQRGSADVVALLRQAGAQ